MIRKISTIGILLITAVVAAFLIIGPGYTERQMNVIDGKPLLKISARAAALHKRLTIVDLHSDSLMWQRSINRRSSQGHMDLPRLAEGNVALQVFSSVTKTPRNLNYAGNAADSDNITPLVIAQLQPIRTWTSLTERTIYHAEKLNRAAAASRGGARMVRSPADLDALLAARASRQTANGGPIGAMMSVEGLHNLEGKRANLDRLYDAGVRMAGFTHFFDNELAGSMHGIKKGRLTAFGRQIVRDMETKGMIIDIAHLSHAGVAELLAMARRPVVSSHGGVQGICPENRNLTDAEIKGVAATGGLIGVGYWEGAACDTSPAVIARTILYIRNLVGIEYIALGSDYDGAVTVRFDTSKLVQVTQALIDAGLTDDEIRAIMGENALRVIRAGLMPQSKASPVNTPSAAARQ